ncbi:MAG: hypothetical protein KatS3mg042_1377 [Rhodothermaceae bacterium]|nr:MAG: hypothetical protein KatS3mg042_1377 [Rhodothermaceae bacterium]
MVQELEFPSSDHRSEALVKGKKPVLIYYDVYRDIFGDHLARPRKRGNSWNPKNITWETTLPGSPERVSHDFFRDNIQPELERLGHELRKRAERLRKDPDEADRADVLEDFTFPPLRPEYFYLVGKTWVMVGWGLADGPKTPRPRAVPPRESRAILSGPPPNSTLSSNEKSDIFSATDSATPEKSSETETETWDWPSSGMQGDEPIDSSHTSDISEPPPEHVEEEGDGDNSTSEHNGTNVSPQEKQTRVDWKDTFWKILLAAIIIVLLIWLLSYLLPGCGVSLPNASELSPRSEITLPPTDEPANPSGSVPPPPGSADAQSPSGPPQSGTAPLPSTQPAPTPGSNSPGAAAAPPLSSAQDDSGLSRDEPEGNGESGPANNRALRSEGNPSSANPFPDPQVSIDANASGPPRAEGRLPIPDPQQEGVPQGSLGSARSGLTLAPWLPDSGHGGQGSSSMTSRIKEFFTGLFDGNEEVPLGQERLIGAVYFWQDGAYQYLYIVDQTGQLYLLDKRPLR